MEKGKLITEARYKDIDAKNVTLDLSLMMDFTE